MASPILIGRVLQTAVALFTAIVPFWADFNETHVHNPNWPPHARFHNGQTMSFGLLTGVISTFFIWRTKLFPSFLPSIDGKDSAVIAAITGCLYWISGVSGILYPGAKWTDPEFKRNQFGPDEIGGQAYGFPVIALLTWIGMWLTAKGLQDKRKVI